MPYSPDQLFDVLAQHGIRAKTTEHAPVFTVEESRALRGTIPGAHTKNLFLRDNKKAHFLVCLEEDVVVDLKRLRALIGARGGLSFASAEALFEHLGVRPGSVSPFAAINDARGAVKVVLDRDLLEAPVINCHPLDNSKTTTITPQDLLTFLRQTNHEPELVSLRSEAP